MVDRRRRVARDLSGNGVVQGDQADEVLVQVGGNAGVARASLVVGGGARARSTRARSTRARSTRARSTRARSTRARSTAGHTRREARGGGGLRALADVGD